jgi:uncharacterized protein YeaO (DUF488 family)
MKPAIRIKRAYEPPSATDGKRVLVDRLWPRGLAKQQLDMDDWQKDLAPSADLRKWFGHDPSKWTEFQKRYERELSGNAAVAAFVEKYREAGVITLLYAGKDEDHTHALILQRHLLLAF